MIIIAEIQRTDYTLRMFNLFVKKNIPEVTPEEVKSDIDNNEKIILLDVRTPEEYAKTHIEKSVNLPLDEVSKKIVSIIPNKNQFIYVYCFSGARSISAVKQMLDLGYNNVFNMPNGILAWRLKRYPLVNN